MEDRICKEEFQATVGHLLAELDESRDEFRHGRISRDTYLQRVTTLRQAGQRFQREFQQAHRIMAAPLK